MNRPAEPAAAAPAATQPLPPRASWAARVGRAFVFTAQRADEEKLLQVASSLTFTMWGPMRKLGLTVSTVAGTA